jgi:hypothetical protein
VTQEGQIEVLASAAMLFGQPLVNQAGGNILLLDGSVSTATLHNAPGATVYGFGTIEADVDNDGGATFIADSHVVGDLVNDGTITIQNGTLTVVGTLTNNGVIVGNSAKAGPGDQPRATGDGLFVQNDYVAGAGSSLLLTPDSALRTGGDFDVAVADHTQFNMAEAAVHMVGFGQVQALELMSKDIGPDPAGLDRTQPGHFPMGRLHIAAPAIVLTVDAHDNDGLGQGTCEVLYVGELEIDAGATLNNPSCRIYYGKLTNHGTVSNPENLTEILPSCGTDIDGDGDVDAQDYAGFEACLAGPGSGLSDVICMCFDFDDSGHVDLRDFATLQEAFTGPQP